MYIACHTYVPTVYKNYPRREPNTKMAGISGAYTLPLGSAQAFGTISDPTFTFKDKLIDLKKSPFSLRRQ